MSDKIKITDDIEKYFFKKIDECETIEELQIIEDFFYEYVEFDKDSWKVLAEISKLKLMFSI